MIIKRNYELEIEVDSDWKPYDTACWFCCPFARLTRLGHVCRAKEAHDKDHIDLCPFEKMREIKK